MQQQQIMQNVDEIMNLYKNFGGDDYIGEPVTQLEHMVQCAQFAEAEGYGEEVILAAFFHDIGHLCGYILPNGEVQHMDGYGLVNHEKMGAEYLRSKGFSEKLATLVASHVQAKRYLTFKDPGYFEKLSEASRKTLEFQGGVMTEDEAIAFENDALSSLYISLRQWDERAKEEDQPIPSLEKYRNMMITHLSKQNTLSTIEF